MILAEFVDAGHSGSVITTALTSLLTGLPVKKQLAMTGEVTITGRVLPVGGIKDKFLAAYREGVKTILYPHTNEKDVSEIPERVRKDLTLIPVKHMDEVLPLALEGWKEFEAKLHKRAGHKKSASGKTRKTAPRAAKKAVAAKVTRPAKKAAKTAKKAVPARKGAAKAKAKGKGKAKGGKRK